MKSIFLAFFTLGIVLCGPAFAATPQEPQEPQQQVVIYPKVPGVVSIERGGGIVLPESLWCYRNAVSKAYENPDTVVPLEERSEYKTLPGFKWYQTDLLVKGVRYVSETKTLEIVSGNGEVLWQGEIVNPLFVLLLIAMAFMLLSNAAELLIPGYENWGTRTTCSTLSLVLAVPCLLFVFGLLCGHNTVMALPWALFAVVLAVAAILASTGGKYKEYAYISVGFYVNVGLALFCLL